MLSALDLVKENIATRHLVLDLSTADPLTFNNDELNSLVGKCDHLETLIISDRRNTYFRKPNFTYYIHTPPFLSQPSLKKLKVLSADNMSFLTQKDIKILASFTELEDLKLTASYFNNYHFLSQLSNLKRLNLSFTKGNNFNALTYIHDLEELSIRGCDINDLSSLKKLEQLKHLDAAENKINHISPILALHDLETLDLSSNPLQDITLIKNLTKLKTLSLNGVGMDTIGDITQLSSLEELYIASNKIEVLTLPERGVLKQVDASSNYIRQIENTGYQVKLVQLRLNHNQLESTRSLEKLLPLRELHLKENQLVSIDGLTALLNLTSLDISDNKISDISCLEKLPKLRKVSMQNNNIKILPEAIFKKFILPLYNLSTDNLSLLKHSIGLGKKPEEGLILTSWEVKLAAGVPIDSTDLTEFQRLVSANLILPNPLTLPAPEMLYQGPEATVAFYQNLRVSHLVPFREAKVILLGEPDAGKSSLLSYFLGEPFIEEKSLTRGVRIARFNFEEGKDQYRINFWDFGGQEVQQSLHQYFLTDNTVYLIILNAVTDEQPDKYLQFLENHAPNSPFFIITNKDDLNGRSKLKNNQIATKFEARWMGPEYRISLKQAASLKNCNDKATYDERNSKLKELFATIQKTFLQLPHIEQGFLSNYKNVKQAVEEMYEKERKPYITMQEFNDFCKAQHIVPGTEKGLLSQLNFIGTVRFVDENNLRGIHILNPEWLSDGMYKIITDTSIKTKMMGKIEKKDVVPILQPVSSTDYTYQDHEIDYLITLMCHFRVAYVEELSGQIYLPDAFPDDLPPELKRADFINGANHYYFSYETDIPSYIIIRFIVKMFKYAKGTQYWNRGIVLQYEEHASNRCEALIEQQDRVIDIWVKGKDIQDFFSLIRFALRSAHEEQFKAWKEMIDLEDHQVSYSDMLTYRYGGETEFKSPVIDPSTGALKKYNINEILGRFEIFKEQQSPDTIINVKGDFNNFGQIQEKDRVATSQPNPAIESYKKEMLRKWKRNGWIFFLLSLAVTILGFIILMQDSIPWIEAEIWAQIRNSQSLKLLQVILPTTWNGFIGKLWYDRIWDKSKEKAFLETLKIPEKLLGKK